MGKVAVWFKKLWLPALNLIGKKNEFRIIITSKNHMEINILFGLIHFEKGEKKEFLIRGTERYIAALMNDLKLDNINVQKILVK